VKVARSRARTGGWNRALPIVVCMTLLGGTAFSARAAVSPPSLKGEILTGTNGSGTDCKIVRGVSRQFTYTVSGTASGPFPGTFTESATYYETNGGTFNATFTIDSPAGQISGTKTAHNVGMGCLNGSGSFIADRYILTYTAQIQTKDGTFTDQGPSAAEMCGPNRFNVCFAGYGEWELTLGQFREEYGPDLLPPTETAPVHTLAAARLLGTTAIPVRLAWLALDFDGVAKYELQESNDGGATFTDVPLPTVSTRTKIVYLDPGANRYQFRVRATDRAGNVSAWASGPVFTVSAFQESSPAISYKGTWQTGPLSRAYGGSVSHTRTAFRAATFSVPAGTRNLAWIAAATPARGQADVFLDGDQLRDRVATVDLYSPTVRNRAIVFKEKDLSPLTSHTLKVRVLGTKNASSTRARVDIDAFVTTS
jgi:hypothetical protein